MKSEKNYSNSRGGSYVGVRWSLECDHLFMILVACIDVESVLERHLRGPVARIENNGVGDGLLSFVDKLQGDRTR